MNSNRNLFVATLVACLLPACMPCDSIDECLDDVPQSTTMDPVLPDNNCARILYADLNPQSGLNEDRSVVIDGIGCSKSQFGLQLVVIGGPTGDGGFATAAVDPPPVAKAGTGVSTCSIVGGVNTSDVFPDFNWEHLDIKEGSGYWPTITLQLMQDGVVIDTAVVPGDVSDWASDDAPVSGLRRDDAGNFHLDTGFAGDCARFV